MNTKTEADEKLGPVAQLLGRETRWTHYCAPDAPLGVPATAYCGETTTPIAFAGTQPSPKACPDCLRHPVLRAWFSR